MKPKRAWWHKKITWEELTGRGKTPFEMVESSLDNPFDEGDCIAEALWAMREGFMETYK